jgi:iron complex transport system substrate-binding protein
VPQHHPSSRPRRAALALAAVLAGSLTACGESSGDEPAATATGGSGAWPVRIEHAFGETTIDEEPQRVVTVGFNEADFALALGVTPVGVRDYLGYDHADRPWASGLLPGEPLPTVGDEEIDVEAVAALEPDLILGVYSFMDEDTYGLLSQIAPTVAESADFPTGGTPWQEQTRMTGRALGAADEAEALVGEVEERIAAAVEANPSFAGAVVPVDYVFGGGHYVLEETDLRRRFFADLGLAAPPTAGELSPELVGELDRDALVVVGVQEQDALADPLLAALPVVAEDRTLFLGDFTQDFSAALGFSSPLSIPFALDVAVPRLAQALDGDPATAVEAYTG